jgi:hypothetical protein
MGIRTPLSPTAKSDTFSYSRLSALELPTPNRSVCL